MADLTHEGSELREVGSPLSGDADRDGRLPAGDHDAVDSSEGMVALFDTMAGTLRRRST